MARKKLIPVSKANVKTAMSVVAGFGIVAAVGAFFGNNPYVKKFFAGLRGETMAAADAPQSDGKWWTFGR